MNNEQLIELGFHKVAPEEYIHPRFGEVVIPEGSDLSDLLDIVYNVGRAAEAYRRDYLATL